MTALSNGLASARAAAFDALRRPALNRAARAVVRPLRNVLPWSVVHNIPILGEVEVDLPDGRRVVFVTDGYDSHASRLYWSGIDGFEPASLRLWLKLLANAKTVLDVGANVGIYGLISAVDNPGVNVHAFEPVPRTFEYLERNRDRNNAANLVVENSAVGETDGTITLHIPRHTRLPSTASVIDIPDEASDDVEVTLVSLDRYTADNGIGPVDLFKLDVEGAEAMALRGAARILDEDKPLILCEVLHQNVGPEMNSVFDDSKWAFFLITEHALVQHRELIGDPSYLFKNYLIVPTEKVATHLAGFTIVDER